MHENLRAGDRIAQWRLLRRIGQGAHGTVYLADDAASGQAVALKLVALPPGAEAAAAQAAFMQRARAVMQLVHPDVVALHAAGIEGPLGWLAMEPVPGGDLARYTQPSRLLPERLVVQLGQRLARALACAHRMGIVHRDLKPANVLVHWPGGIVKLADFGLARFADAEQSATGFVLGSPAYMAPEQLAGAVPTPRSDLYALGTLLYQLLAGRLPHEGGSMGELLRQVASEPAPDLARLRPGLPPALPSLVARLLVKRADDRPGDGDAVAAELGAVAADWPPE